MNILIEKNTLVPMRDGVRSIAKTPLIQCKPIFDLLQSQCRSDAIPQST